MSVQAMTWAWMQSCHPSTKIVLMALADHADSEGICWPGVKGVAEKCGMSAEAVRYHLRALRHRGLVISEPRQREDGSSTSNIYRLPVNIFTPPYQTFDTLPVKTEEGGIKPLIPCLQTIDTHEPSLNRHRTIMESRDGTSANADSATPAETPEETLTVTDSEEEATAPPDSAPAPPWLVEARQLPKWPGGAERETALAGWLRERGVSDDCALRAAVALRARWGTTKAHTYHSAEAALRNWCLTQVQIDAKGNGSAKGENARWLAAMRGVERGASKGRPVQTI